MELEIRKANLKDVNEIHELVDKYARQRKMLYRPVSQINSKIRDYFVCIAEKKVVGCVALRIWDGKWAEIIALAVEEAYERNGIGISLVNSCIADAKILGVKNILILTFSDNLATKAGFKKLDDFNILPQIIYTEKVINTEKAYVLKIT